MELVHKSILLSVLAEMELEAAYKFKRAEERARTSNDPYVLARAAIKNGVWIGVRQVRKALEVAPCDPMTYSEN